MATAVFVSFDYENDRRYKFMLEAWHANPRFQFVFQDETPREIDSTNIGRIKAALTRSRTPRTHSSSSVSPRTRFMPSEP